MLDKTRIQRVSSDTDPTLQSEKADCGNMVEKGSSFCLVHGGNKATEAAEANGLRNYRLSKANARLGQLRNNSFIKDLRDEIAILRIILEERLNALSEPSEMILHSGALSELVLKIEKLVTSCHKLEMSMGSTLDKSTVANMAEGIVKIISSHVSEQTLSTIVADIDKLINQPIVPQDKE